MDQNRRLAELLKICWHELEFDPLGDKEFPYCKHCGRQDIPWHWECPNGKCFRIADSSPDFTDPRLVLREMRKRKDWLRFIDYTDGGTRMGAIRIDVHLVMDDTGKLRSMAIAFLEGH